MLLGEAARRVGKAMSRRPAIVPTPASLHYALALLLEAAMKIPLIFRERRCKYFFGGDS